MLTGSLYERIWYLNVTIPESVYIKKKIVTVVSSVILFRTSEHRSRFSTVQSPVKLIAERQIDPFTETTIKITCAWNVIEVQNEGILKYWSIYSAILLLSLIPRSPLPILPSIHLSSCSYCLFVRFLVRPLFHECMHSLDHSPSFTFSVNQSIEQFILWLVLVADTTRALIG